MSDSALITIGNGTVTEYPCDCYAEFEADDENHVCWIVRYPNLSFPVSFPTKEEAVARLVELNKE
jgi:hypothetical protein